MDSLSQVHPKLFFKHSCGAAIHVARDRYYVSEEARPGIIISLEIFIGIIFKYTKSQLHGVNLDAVIIPSKTMPFYHDFVVWGVCDVGLRTGKGATKLPGFQEGIWTWILEFALEYGILPEQIQQFRRNLCLREIDGEHDDSFFHVYRDFEDGL